MKKEGFQRRTVGFTLFEVIMAISIFVLLVGGVYFTVSVALQASMELAEVQMTSRKRSAFVSFLRKGFTNLPVEAEFILRSRDQGNLGRSVELLIKNAPGAFETGALESMGSGIVLATVPDAAGKSRFSMTRFPSQLSEDDRDRFIEQADWLPILEDIETLRWRFWDASLKEFVETWDQATVRPELIELTFTPAAEQEVISIFRLVDIAREGEVAPEQEQENEQ